jgi:hypothetical protein
MQLVLPDVRVRWTRLPALPATPFKLRYHICDHGCCLIFCLHGMLQLQREPALHENGKIESGCCGLLAKPCTCRCLASSTCGGARVVDVNYSRPFLQKLMEPGSLHLPRWMDGRKEPWRGISKISPSMDHILRMMEDHAASGEAHPLFMTAKALELMWLFTGSLSRLEKSQISPSDRQAVHDAQAILETFAQAT